MLQPILALVDRSGVFLAISVGKDSLEQMEMLIGIIDNSMEKVPGLSLVVVHPNETLSNERFVSFGQAEKGEIVSHSFSLDGGQGRCFDHRTEHATGEANKYVLEHVANVLGSQCFKGRSLLRIQKKMDSQQPSHLLKILEGTEILVSARIPEEALEVAQRAVVAS